MMKNLKKIFPILAVVPFIIGTAGFRIAGLNWADSCYNSVSLYVIQLNEDCSNIYIEIARWSAAIVATAAVLSILKQAGLYLLNLFLSILPGSAALYGNEEIVRQICDKERYAFYGGNAPVNSRHHIILYDNDAENLSFYRDNKEKMKGGSVWLAVRDLDLSFLKADDINLHFFNPNALTARLLWNDPDLNKIIKSNRNAKIVLLGFDRLGEQILMQGFLHNVFYEDQSYEYHVFDDKVTDPFEKNRFISMNEDKIIFHDRDISGDDNFEPDIIICTKDMDFNLMEELWLRYPNALIYFYSESDLKLHDFMVDDRVRFFGEADRVYTLSNIITDKLYENGIVLNYNYDHNESPMPDYKSLKADPAAYKNARESWTGLNEFTKGSNIASADYLKIVGILSSEEPYKDMDPEERDWCFARLEHILWCRYHFINHWTYGRPEDGKNKDSIKRIHTCLTDFSNLTEENQRKDLDVILSGRRWGMTN